MENDLSEPTAAKHWRIAIKRDTIRTHGLGSLQCPPDFMAPPLETSISGRKILVVDDNRDAAATLAILLRMGGNETHTAHDGEEALAKAATIRPDVFIIDIGLPKWFVGLCVSRRGECP